MLKKNTITGFCLVLTCLLLPACSWLHSTEAKGARLPFSTVDQIDSFKPETACEQAVKVINNNPFSQEFFESVFARLIQRCNSSKSPQNADIIWNNFVEPLKANGKVPGDLLVTTWNYYFSKDFVSLPDTSTINQNCYRLPEIKKNIEKEYRLKIKGFEVTQQESPDAYFLNAMYVFNTMWAACHGTKE